MSPTGGPGWLTTLADLALILFMVTTAQLTQAEFARSSAQAVRSPVEETFRAPIAIVGEAPLDIYRPGEAAQGLGEWLAGRPRDPRERLTIRVDYGARNREAMLAEGLRQQREAELAGWQPRLIIQPAAQDDISAMIAFDRADEASGSVTDPLR